MEDFLQGVLRWWPLISTGFTLLFAWILWSMGQRFASKEDLSITEKQIENKVMQVDTRLIRVEEAVKHVPERDDVQRILEAMAEQSAAVSGLAAQISGVQTHISALTTTVNMLVKNELEGRR
jgi:replicative DNA helicase